MGSERRRSELRYRPGQGMGKTDQIARVLALAQALASTRRGVALRSFAERHEWPLRSVYRDLKTLEGAGYPIEKNDGRYRLVDGWQPPGHAGLDRDEVLALFAARHVVGAMRATSLGRALDRLWAKLSATGPQSALFPAADSPIAVRTTLAIDYASHATTIQRLERAIEERRVVRLAHVSVQTGESTEREVEPGELYYDPGLETMYLIGWCRLRRAVRVFAVHRLRDVEERDEGFTSRPEARSPVALRGAFRVWRGEALETVVLRFSPAVSREIRERQWHASQVLRELPDGGVELTLEVAGAAELRRWLLGYGADVRVLQPGSLASAVAEAHAAAATAQRGRRPLKARPRESLPAGDNRLRKDGRRRSP